MKTIHLSILFLTSLILFSVSCTPSRTETELRATIDSLQTVIANCNGQTKGMNSFNEEIGAIRSEPISMDVAVQYTKEFRDPNLKSIQIPQAILFDSADLKMLANIYPYVRFYCGVKPGNDALTLLAVGVDEHNVDDTARMTVNSQGDPINMMFEFADPCPPCPKGQNNNTHANNRLHPVNTPKTIKFNR
jgi:hypothetical protein